MKEEITFRSTLLECLEWKTGLKKLCSMNREGRIPAYGMDDLFAAEEEKCRKIRELIQALENGEVRAAIAGWREHEPRDWQREIMERGGVPEERMTF